MRLSNIDTQIFAGFYRTLFRRWNISNKMLKEIIYKSFKEVLGIFSEADNSLIEIIN
jgi:hypothetical protein